MCPRWGWGRSRRDPGRRLEATGCAVKGSGLMWRALGAEEGKLARFVLGKAPSGDRPFWKANWATSRESEDVSTNRKNLKV